MSIDLLRHQRAVASTRRRKPTIATPRDRAPAEMPAWVQKAKNLPDIRWDKVARVREALRAGHYDVDTRLQDLMLDLPDELAILKHTTG